ncbi:GT2 family glycosyltransferase [Microbacterium sp. SLBN-154]|uniref:glycosyltransferase n=1 Tax=Microbacterium sp. SLBN-154 TaxID=2768458 RepID=UPI00114DF777|nr:glycosyltransferase [Microbacterium sp. SLBN-154]TQK19018.1 GT2 family glycosyltransferase [Microbacterium sp. SLBN-154]
MPARVHAFLVVRPDGRTTAAPHLRRTLAALRQQSRPVDALTIVLCGESAGLSEIAASSGAESVITASASTGFAAATALASRRLDGDAVWLLAQDTAPEPDALRQLVGALELAPSVALVAPKLVRWDDRSEIVSLGVTLTLLGRTVGLADGELDQGQHDARQDVLGADVRGLLVRADAWRALEGLDPGLSGADEGLDLGIRARLAGSRVSIVPSALIATEGDGVAGLPAPTTARRRRRRAFATRAAELHRRLVYAHPAAVFALWLTILPIAVWRTAAHLVTKQPERVLPEWWAAVVALVRIPPVMRARRRIRRTRRASWLQLAALRISQSELRERLDDEADAEAATDAGVFVRRDLHFFTGGGAWLVLGALVVSVAAFTALLAWPVMGGGGLLPLRTTLTELWADAAFGRRQLGLDVVGPADPFATLLAIIGSLWPGDPSRALVLLWVLALPLAAAGGWFAATRVTERSGLRLLGGALWALAPAFLAALTEGRPAAVILHLLLPWLFYTGAVAHRSWAAAGVASLLLAAVIACAPSLAPAFVALWVLALLLSIVARSGRGTAQLVWTLVPTVVMAAPLVWWQGMAGQWWALVADPGLPWSGSQVGADVVGRSLLIAGLPSPDAGGWATMLDGVWVWWVPLLVAPLAILALLAPLTPRWATGISLLVITALGIVTAFVAVGISVSVREGESVPLWPGPGLSLAWIGLVGGSLVALDSGFAPRMRSARVAVAFTAGLAIAVLAVPQLTALARGASELTNGPDSTLPAFIAAEGGDDPDVGTLVLTPQNGGGMAAAVVWGESETLSGQSTLEATRATPTSADSAVATLAVDLISTTGEGSVAELAGRGIGFVVLAPAAIPESDAARAFRLDAVLALDQRNGLDNAGATPKGELWRVTGEVAARPDLPASAADLSRLILGANLAVLAIALLLAVPTRASRRAARRTPRIVGFGTSGPGALEER